METPGSAPSSSRQHTTSTHLDVYRKALRPPPKQVPDAAQGLLATVHEEEAWRSSDAHPPGNTTSSTHNIIQLKIGFDVHAHELAVGFDTAQHARLYQRRNPEARILLDVAPRQVLLPLHEGTRTLTSTPAGLVLVFETRAQAVRWAHRTLLAHLDERSGAAAVLPRIWAAKDLTDIIVPGQWGAQRLGDLVQGDGAVVGVGPSAGLRPCAAPDAGGSAAGNVNAAGHVGVRSRETLRGGRWEVHGRRKAWCCTRLWQRLSMCFQEKE